ncbi:MAG: hypothetical protein QOD75_1998 [Blastocatellia bacterium]|jgi:hypothetical protein|nr:hypothetical protein [Blastocatellia bacterium]
MNSHLRKTLLILIVVMVSVIPTSAQSGRARQNSLTSDSARVISQDPVKTVPTEKDQAKEVFPIRADYNPNAVLRGARVLFIRSKSAYLKSSDLENEMRQRPEFSALGLLVTKEEGNADLILEVGRKVPGRKFIYSGIDPRTQIVLTSGSARADLFGLAPSVAHKIAKRFLQRVQAAR